MFKMLIFIACFLSFALQAETEALPLELAIKNGLNINEAYLKVNDIWRELAGKTSGKITDFEFLKADQKKILENQELNEHFEDLIKVGKIRSNYIKYLAKNSPDFFQRQLDNGLITDLVQEIKIIPMKWIGNFLVFALHVKTSLSEGFKGFKDLVKLVFEFLSVLFFPIIGIWLIRKIVAYLTKEAQEAKSFRFKGVSYYRRYRLFLNLSLYSRWPLYYILFHYLKSFFQTYEFWFAAIELYIIYKFFLFLTTNLFKSLKADESSTEAKARRAALVISRIVFFSYFFLLFSQSIIGQGITFHLLKELTFWVLLFVSTILLARWNNDLAVIIEKYKWGTLGQKLAKLLTQKRFFFMSYPALFIVLVARIFYFSINFLERFDFFKQISAQVFKRKLESSDAFQETDLESLPEAYIKLFEPNERELNEREVVSSHKDVQESIMNEISTWKDNPIEENSSAIYGDKGCGKTTLLNNLIKNIDQDINILRPNMNIRFTSSRDLLVEIGKLFDLDLIESFAPLIQKDKELAKTLIVIDSAQNVFLSQMGGFEAYKTFTELINLRLENIYWLAAFNNASWNFLKTVFEQNQSFRFSLELKSWKEESIKALILNRHEQLDYRLSFSQILRVVQGGYNQEAIENAEELFFRVLWEQSSGNPRVALYLWLSSLNYKGGKLLSVGLPHGDDLEILKKLSDDTLFIYAAIMRHENLSAKETTSVTNIPESAVRYALKVGLENNFLLRRPSGQYTFNTRFQYTLNRYLRERILSLETKDLNQILEIASLFEFNKILWMILSFVVLFFVVKKLNQWSTNLKEKFPGKRLLILQSSTIFSFILSIIGTFAIIYGVLKPSKEILLALTGSAAVAIGFSLKDLVSSLIAGIVLLFDRPFQVGDRVTFKEIYGEIVKIGLRAVRLSTLDDNLVTIPNSEFMSNAVASGNAGALDMMVVMNIHVALDEDIPKINEVLYEVLITSRYIYLAKPVRLLVSETEVAHRLALKFTLKAYVLDVKYEKAFESDIYTRAFKELNKLEIKRPTF